MKQQTRQPNVIWIFGDQHRAQALGYEGDPNVVTPTLDRLATEALLPTGIAGCPLCCPYRGSLLTSRYPHQCVPGHAHPLPEGMPTITQPFHEGGYDTAYFGKWHLGGIHAGPQRLTLASVPRSLRGGFQRWIGYDNNNSQYDTWVHGHDKQGREIPHFRLDGYETDVLTDMLIDYVTDHANSRKDLSEVHPFFAVLSVQPPHDPHVAPEEFMRRHNAGTIQHRENVPDVGWVRERASRELAGYYAMVENLDWNVGRIRDALWKTGATEDTHVIFFSDHGDMHGSHGQFRKTIPYQESIRVPMMLGGGQSHEKYGQGRRDFLVNHVDIAPTSLGLAGLPVPDWMQGTDYSAARLSPDGSGAIQDYPDSAYIQLVTPSGHPDSTDRPWRGVVTVDGWKYVCLEHQPWLMFDLKTDPFEQVNLAYNTVFSAQRRRLHDRLAAWVEETGDTFVMPGRV